MKESVTYQAILKEGEELGRAQWSAFIREMGSTKVSFDACLKDSWDKGWTRGQEFEARKLLLLLGRRIFKKEPSAKTLAAVNAANLPRLEDLINDVLIVSSWSELLKS